MSDLGIVKHTRIDRDAPDGKEYGLTGLPLDRVDMSMTLTADDLRDGTDFPPARFERRLHRQDVRERAARGDFRGFSLAPDTHPVTGHAWIETYREIMSALLLAETPGPDLPEPQRKSLLMAVPLLIEDLIDHGHGLVLGHPDLTVEAMPFSAAYPLDDGGWVWVQPGTSTSAQSDEADQATILTWEPDGTLTLAVRGWTGAGGKPVVGGYSHGTFAAAPDGAVIMDGYPLLGVSLGSAMMPPIRGGTGRSITDKLITTAAHLALRHTSLTAALSDNEQPRLVVLGALEDLKVVIARPGEDPGQITTEQLRSRLPSLASREILNLTDGVRDVRWLTLDSPMDASYRFIDLLYRTWTEATGLPPLESGQSASAQSGVAVARKSALAVAVAHQIRAACYDALVEARGGAEFDWPAPTLDQTEPADPALDTGQPPGPGPEMETT